MKGEGRRSRVKEKGQGYFFFNWRPHRRPLYFFVLLGDSGRINVIYYPTALRRVQITPKTSTNITRYLYSRGPVKQVFSQRASDELD